MMNVNKYIEGTTQAGRFQRPACVDDERKQLH